MLLMGRDEGSEDDKVLRGGPIGKLTQDELEMRGSAVAIAEMLKEVDPPFTVGLRGDWGSGKSSLMKMVRDHLDPDSSENKCSRTNSGNRRSAKSLWSRIRSFGGAQEKKVEHRDNNSKIKVIEFNPWSDSQLVRDYGASSRMIEQFVQKLCDHEIIEQKLGNQLILKYRRRILRGAALALGQAASNFATRGFANANTESLSQKRGSDEEKLDDVIFSDELRNDLEAKLEEQEMFDRLIFIIDDLDRLAPTEAIDILDVITSLLKMPKCVFIIAVDQEMIEPGVIKKMRLENEPRKDGMHPAAQNYFDKVFNFSIRISNTLSSRSVENITKQTVSGELIPGFARQVIAACAFDNPRSVKRLMWLAHYRRLEYRKTPSPNENNSGQNEDTKKASSIEQLCAALGAIEDAYPIFHSIVFRAGALSDNGEHWRKTYAALTYAAKTSESQSPENNFGHSEENNEEETEYERVSALWSLDNVSIEKLGKDIRRALEEPARLPGQLDEGEREMAFSAARSSLLQYFVAILGKVVEEWDYKEESVSKEEDSEPLNAYMSRRHSGWLGTYIAASLEASRKEFGASYSYPQQIYRYWAKNWAFCTVYVDKYSGYLKDYLGGFVVLIGAKALEVWMWPPENTGAFDGAEVILEGKLKAPEPLQERPAKTPPEIKRQSSGVIGNAGQYQGVDYAGEPSAKLLNSVCIFRYEFADPLQDNSDFEQLYDGLSEMVIEVIRSCVEATR